MARLTRGARISGADRQALGAELSRRYGAGESIRSMADDLGRSYGFVQGLLKEGGVALRTRGGATRGAQALAVRRETRAAVEQVRAEIDAAGAGTAAAPGGGTTEVGTRAAAKQPAVAGATGGTKLPKDAGKDQKAKDAGKGQKAKHAGKDKKAQDKAARGKKAKDQKADDKEAKAKAGRDKKAKDQKASPKKAARKKS